MESITPMMLLMRLLLSWIALHGVHHVAHHRATLLCHPGGFPGELWSARRALSAFWRTAAPISSIDATVCCSAAACCSVRADKS